MQIVQLAHAMCNSTKIGALLNKKKVGFFRKIVSLLIYIKSRGLCDNFISGKIIFYFKKLARIRKRYD